jgi:hypothetical protein
MILVDCNALSVDRSLNNGSCGRYILENNVLVNRKNTQDTQKTTPVDKPLGP